MTDVPPEALDAVDRALGELPQPDSGFERDRWRITSRIALNAAAPLIAAAERARFLSELGKFRTVADPVSPEDPFDGVAWSDVERVLRGSS